MPRKKENVREDLYYFSVFSSKLACFLFVTGHMDKVKWFSSILVLVLLSLVAFTIPRFQESDSQTLIRFKANQSKAPALKYPTRDAIGRQIPPFNFLVVFPDCTSCSDYRVRVRSFMADHPNFVFLILTPDLNGSDDLFEHKRYFVCKFDSKSVYAQIPAGCYAR